MRIGDTKIKNNAVCEYKQNYYLAKVDTKLNFNEQLNIISVKPAVQSKCAVKSNALNEKVDPRKRNYLVCSEFIFYCPLLFGCSNGI